MLESMSRRILGVVILCLALFLLSSAQIVRADAGNDGATGSKKISLSDLAGKQQLDTPTVTNLMVTAFPEGFRYAEVQKALGATEARIRSNLEQIKFLLHSLQVSIKSNSAGFTDAEVADHKNTIAELKSSFKLMTQQFDDAISYASQNHITLPIPPVVINKKEIIKQREIVHHHHVKHIKEVIVRKNEAKPEKKAAPVEEKKPEKKQVVEEKPAAEKPTPTPEAKPKPKPVAKPQPAVPAKRKRPQRKQRKRGRLRRRFGRWRRRRRRRLRRLRAERQRRAKLNRKHRRRGRSRFRRRRRRRWGRRRGRRR